MAIELSKEDTQSILPSIIQYMREEFEVELSEMRAGFLLKYFMEEIAPFAYNKGVRDAEQYMQEKVEDLTGVVYEAPLNYWKKKKKGK
jgi:uncharacterized protein (DUF2164 family)